MIEPPREDTKQGRDKNRPRRERRTAGGGALSRRDRERDQQEIVAGDQPGHAPVAPACRHDTLIDVLAVRLPDAPAAQQAPGQGQRRIRQVVGRQQQRRLPSARRRQRQHEPAGQITERDAADIAEKNLRGMPVPEQKAERHAGERQPEGPQPRRRRTQQRQQKGAKAEARALGAADPVDPVHEVEEVHEPEPGQRRQGVIDDDRKRTLKDKGAVRERPDPGADRRDLREQAQQSREASAQIVEPRHRGERERGSKRHPEQRDAGCASTRQPKREPDRKQDADDGDAAAARDCRPVAGALVGAVHDAVAQQQPPHEAGESRRRREARAARRKRRREAHRARTGAPSAVRPSPVSPRRPLFTTRRFGRV